MRNKTGNRRQSNIKNRASYDALWYMGEKAAERLLIFVLAMVALLFVLYPLVCILLRSLQAGGGYSLAKYAEVWQSYKGSLLNSLWAGVAVAVLATVFAVALALFVATRRSWLKLLFTGLLLVVLVSPPFVSSLSYIQLYGRRGWITHRLLGLSLDPYNAWGVILMQSISFVPLNALFLAGMLERLDTGSLKAAQDLGAAPARQLKDVLLPFLRPGIGVSLLLAFVRSVADYATPVIIGGRFHTIASDIYLQFVGYSDIEKAAAMNMFLLLPSILAFFLYRFLQRRTDVLTGGVKVGGVGGFRLGRCGVWGWLGIGVSVFYALVVILQYAVVFISGFIKRTKYGTVFTTEYLSRLWQYDAETILRSIVYALVVAVLGTLAAALWAYYLNRRQLLLRGFWDCLLTLPYMLPGSCFGIGYVLAFNGAPFYLTGTALIVLVNMMFRQLPTTTRLCAAALSQISPAMEKSARDLGCGPLRIVKDVVLPGLRPAFLSCFAYNFSASMTGIGAILFLIDPGQKLLVFELFDAVYSGDYALASLIAALIMVIVLTMEILLGLILRRSDRYVFKA